MVSCAFPGLAKEQISLETADESESSELTDIARFLLVTVKHKISISNVTSHMFSHHAKKDSHHFDLSRSGQMDLVDQTSPCLAYLMCSLDPLYR